MNRLRRHAGSEGERPGRRGVVGAGDRAAVGGCVVDRHRARRRHVQLDGNVDRRPLLQARRVTRGRHGGLRELAQHLELEDRVAVLGTADRRPRRPGEAHVPPLVPAGTVMFSVPPAPAVVAYTCVHVVASFETSMWYAVANAASQLIVKPLMSAVAPRSSCSHWGSLNADDQRVDRSPSTASLPASPMSRRTTPSPRSRVRCWRRPPARHRVAPTPTGRRRPRA